VLLESAARAECLGTEGALEWPVSRVCTHVLLQVAIAPEALSAIATLERLVSLVHPQVLVQPR